MASFPGSVSDENIITVTLSDNHDRTIRVEPLRDEEVVPMQPTKLFKVEIDKILQSSSMMATMLSSRFREFGLGIVTIEEACVMAAEVWLRQTHGNSDDYTLKMTLFGIWHLLRMCDYRDIGTLEFKEYYSGWYTRNVTNLKSTPLSLYASQLLTPSWAFDNAAAFMEVTRWLIYNTSGSISESNPLHSKDMTVHMSGHVIHTLNAAYGRVRNILTKSLFPEVIQKMAYARQPKCFCKKLAFADYHEALSGAKVNPNDDAFEKNRDKATIEVLCKRLDKFDWEPDTCKICGNDPGVDFKETAQAAAKIRLYIQGLCLDCMDRTQQNENGRYHEDYWMYWQGCERDNYSLHCRMTHTQPTWYFSFMGKIQDHKQRQRQINRRGKGYSHDSDDD